MAMHARSGRVVDIHPLRTLLRRGGGPWNSVAAQPHERPMQLSARVRAGGRQRYTIVADWARVATALAFFTAIEIAWLASINLFCTQFANISAAPSRQPPSQHDEKQDLDVIFGSITFPCAHRQDKAVATQHSEAPKRTSVFLITVFFASLSLTVSSIAVTHSGRS